MKKYFIKYYSIIIFTILFFLIEMCGTYLVEGKFRIFDLRYMVSLLLIINTILFLIKNDKARFITTVLILAVQGSFNFFFIIMFEMTGQHFDYSMFQLRNDAMGIIEKIPLDFVTSFIFFLCISILYVFGNRLDNKVVEKKVKEPFIFKTKLVVASLLFIIGLSSNYITANSILSTSEDIYESMLYGTESSKYNQYGITSNFINELYSGLLYNKKEQISTDLVEKEIYKQTSNPSQYFGVSEGNNVITILGETLEWFAFVSDEVNYPNGLKLTDEELRDLFPNFYKMFDGSVILDNYHAKEKTDVSEMYTMMGSYPKETYINYDHVGNNFPFSLANTLEIMQDYNYKYTFHNGTNTFYNRNIIHKDVGFTHYYSSEEIAETYPDKFTNYIDGSERNLDSELFDACKELMFPTSEKFYNYALTITMHGRFDKRQNLEELGYYDRLREFGIDIDDPTILPTSNEASFITYLATALDLDKMIGIMFDYLEENNLLETTTIVFFSDHYAYYQGLSSYIKDIYAPKDSLEKGKNYLELYRVPAMIYDTKLVSAIDNNNDTRVISKFTNGSDIVPTLLDILGVRYYSNMYFGNNIFSSTESLSYSRSYDVFFNDKIYFKNLNNISFFYSEQTDEAAKANELENYIKYDLNPRANVLIEKMRYMDQVYYFDLYSQVDKYDDFIKYMNLINE